jgi:hypothetical protein
VIRADGWLVAFVYAAAVDVDKRTGSLHAPAIRTDLAQGFPVTALEWQLSELTSQLASAFRVRLTEQERELKKLQEQALG